MYLISIKTWFIFTLLVAFPCNHLKAQDWKGIKPIQSTKDDVERILGAPLEANESRAKYRLEEADIYIVFASSKAIRPCVRRLPAGTVMLITVTPRKKIKFAELGLNQTDFEISDPSAPSGIGYQCLTNKTSGVVIRTLNGYIDEIHYIANEKDSDRCSEYYTNPRSFCNIIVDSLKPQNQ